MRRETGAVKINQKGTIYRNSRTLLTQHQHCKISVRQISKNHNHFDNKLHNKHRRCQQGGYTFGKPKQPLIPDAAPSYIHKNHVAASCIFFDKRLLQKFIASQEIWHQKFSGIFLGIKMPSPTRQHKTVSEAVENVGFANDF